MAQLVRYTVEDPEIAEREEQKFADRARMLLGYKMLLQHQGDLKLLKTLRELNIDPFTAESVKAYQEDAIEAARRDPKWKWIIQNVCMAICGISAIVVVASIVWLGITLCFFSNASLPGLVLCASFLVVMVSGVTAAMLERGFEWQFIRIENYNSPIPEFALQTAMDVKEHCSDVTIYVQELQESKDKIDPFLVLVSPDNKHYYVEVWNEPKFKSYRQE